jgi:hypothetical protein
VLLQGDPEEEKENIKLIVKNNNSRWSVRTAAINHLKII